MCRIVWCHHPYTEMWRSIDVSICQQSWGNKNEEMLDTSYHMLDSCERKVSIQSVVCFSDWQTTLFYGQKNHQWDYFRWFLGKSHLLQSTWFSVTESDRALCLAKKIICSFPAWSLLPSIDRHHWQSPVTIRNASKRSATLIFISPCAKQTNYPVNYSSLFFI